MKLRQAIFLIAVILNSSMGVMSQKRSFELQVIAEANIPVFENERGFGGLVKGLYGVGQKGELTLAAGFSKFKPENAVEIENNMRLIPFLAGYRYNFYNFYIEPQVGFQFILPLRDFSTQSKGEFFGSFSAGYEIKRFTGGVRFQTVKGIRLYIGYALLQKK
jgi:hypothetical protein